MKDLIIASTVNQYESFCHALKGYIDDDLSFNFFKREMTTDDVISRLCVDIYPEELNQLSQNLNNPELGISAIDIPEIQSFSEKENTIFGVAIVLGLFSNLGSPNIDPTNQFPFVIHTASHSNERQLNEYGLEKLSPEMKLGFHNDGLLNHNKIEIPAHILVYNVFLGYQNPGNFIWIPTALWKEANQFKNLAEEQAMTLTIKLNPNYHLDEGTIKNSLLDFVKVPISTTTIEGQARFFLNGKVLPEYNTEQSVLFMQNMRDSLEDNPVKISIPQKERRAFYIKNTDGFHARNIFSDPIDSLDLTRVYLRIVDTNTELYSILN